MSTGIKAARQFQGLFEEVIPFVGTVTLTATAGAETSDTVTVTGARPGDIVLVGLEEDTEDGVMTANVNANDTVEITLVNATGSTITIASAQIRGVVLKTNGQIWTALGSTGD